MVPLTAFVMIRIGGLKVGYGGGIASVRTGSDPASQVF